MSPPPLVPPRRLLRAVALVLLAALLTVLHLAATTVSSAGFASSSATATSPAAARGAFACEAYDAQVRVTGGPGSFWRLGETGTTAADSLGSRPGSYVGAPSQSQPAHSSTEADGAVALNGSSQYVEVPDVYDFAGTATFTVQTWVRPASTASWADYPRLVGKELPGDLASRQGWNLVLGPSGEVIFERWRDGTADRVRSAGTLVPGRWHHVAGSYDGTSVTLHLDGVAASAPATRSLLDTSAPLLMGAAARDFVDNRLAGSLDDVSIVPRALSSAEIVRHARANCTYASVVRRTPGLASYWDLDELTLTAVDRVGGHDAVPDGPVAAGAPGALPSNSRYARDFAGTGSLRAGDVYDFAARSPSSVEAWVLGRPASFAQYARLLAKENSGAARSGWSLLVHPDGRLGHERWDNGVVTGGIGTPGPLVAGRWYHLVYTYDGTTSRLYLDGALAASDTFAGPLPDTTAPLRIGGTDNGTHSRWTGRLDEVAVYTQALTAAQVAAHYAAR